MMQNKPVIQSDRLTILLEILQDGRPHSTGDIEDAYRARGRRNVAVGSTVADLRKKGFYIDAQRVENRYTYRLISRKGLRNGHH